MEKSNIELAGKYIFENGFLNKWGFRLFFVPNTIAHYQQKFVCEKFGLGLVAFSKAMRHAKFLANQATAEHSTK